MNTINPHLIPYRVMLHEEPGDKFQIVFDCQAESDDHAVEQAENAYPHCDIISYLPFDRLPLDFVAYSPNESAISDGAGFWSNGQGWVTLEDASRFTKDEIDRMTLPISTGQDARWVLWEEAHESYGGQATETAKVRLTLDVTYALNGVDAAEMVSRLHKMCERAIGDGMLTGETAAEVEEYSMDAMIRSEVLTNRNLARDDMAIRCRCVNGEFWEEDGVPRVFPSLADAVQAGNAFLSDTFGAGLDYSEEDVEVICNDDVLTLSEARQQLMALTLQEAGEVLEALADQGDNAPVYLAELARACRVALHNK